MQGVGKYHTLAFRQYVSPPPQIPLAARASPHSACSLNMHIRCSDCRGVTTAHPTLSTLPTLQAFLHDLYAQRLRSTMNWIALPLIFINAVSSALGALSLAPLTPDMFLGRFC